MLVNNVTIEVRQRWLIFAVCLLGILLMFAVVQMGSSSQALMHIGQGANYISDDNNQYDLNDILQLPDFAWEVEQSEQLSFGMADHPYWIKFQIPGATSSGSRLIEIDYALLDSVNIWFYADGREVSYAQVGDSFPFDQRAHRHEKLLVYVPQSAQPLDVYIKVSTTGTIRLPMRLWEEDTYLIYNGEHNIAMGLFFGFLAAMALSNLFFFITTYSITFLLYCGYVVFVALTLASLHGLTYKYMWPENLWLQSRSIGIFATTTLFFAVVFSNKLLEVKNHSKLLHKILKAASGIFLAGILVSMLIPYSIYIKVFMLMLTVGVVLILGVGSFLWYKGVPIARFFTLAWLFLLVSGFIAALDNSDLISLNTPSHYLLMLGTAVETFLLALALALSYNQQSEQLFESQAIALQKERLAREAQEKILQVKEEAQEELEYKVEERTLELEIALRELAETNSELEKKNTIDALTGVRNRSYFDKKHLAEVRRSRREQTPLSIVMIDIDHFKQINDTHGHLIGDECIKFIAKMLEKSLRRPSDDVCRYGGEEFALILPNTDLEGARLVAEGLRQQIEQQAVSTEAGDINMTISAGVCSAVVTGMGEDKYLLENADKALYRAKRQGRNKVCVHLDPPELKSQEI